jgi:hypothetical protein
VLGVVGGLALMRRWTTIPLGVLLGGLLLVLSSGGSTENGLLSFYQSFLTFNVAASDEMRLVNFVLLLGASIALLWYGITTWEEPAGPRADDEA